MLVILAKAEKWNFSFGKVNIELHALKRQFSYVSSLSPVKVILRDRQINNLVW